MNPLQQVFNYQGQQVRTVVKDGQPWFVAKDVCEVFGDTNYRRSISRLDEDEKGVSPLSTPGGTQNLVVVNEPGLYTLLFNMQPQKKASMTKEAYEHRVASLKQFKRWITHEVIPSIRKTGQYIAQPKTQSELILMLAQQNVENERRLRQLEERANAAHHRIDNIDKIDTIGDPQQRLNAMIRKYAADNGLSFQRAWREFKQAFNTAYRTNLTMLIENYKMKHGIKKLSMPEYLSKVDRLEDAIRVADKLLNRAS